MRKCSLKLARKRENSWSKRKVQTQIKKILKSVEEASIIWKRAKTVQLVLPNFRQTKLFLKKQNSKILLVKALC